MVKWLLSLCAAAVAVAAALSVSTASAQTPDPLIDPGTGAAGSRFQVVGQSGWTPGETVMISVGFSDLDPAGAYAGPFYHERAVTVLRDGTWSFPIVVNNELVPFPLWRPGFIVVRAASPAKTSQNSFVYTVEGRTPLGTPPLANLGAGPAGSHQVAPATLALFAAAVGALLLSSGMIRRRSVAVARDGRQAYGVNPISRRNASWLGSRPRKPRTNSSPSTLPPRSRILRR